MIARGCATLKRTRRGLVYALAVTAMLVMSCSLIVSGDLPAYHCTGSDPSSCPSAMVCDTVSLLCVGPDRLDGGDDGLAAPDDGSDATIDGEQPGPAEIGGSCVAHRDCKPGLLCGTSTILTTAIVGTSASPICTKPCCTSADCPSSFICFSAGTGGNYCVPGELAQREQIGAKRPGDACSGNDDCRSGLCSLGHCLDSCCKDKDCTGGTVCRVTAVAVPPPSHEAWACSLPSVGATTDAGASCQGGLKCKNDNCSGVPLKCRPSCCNSAACVAYGNNLGICAYGTFLSSNSDAKWCFDANQAGPNPLGAGCSGDANCASRLCDLETKTCAAACCEDGDCPGDMACRPSPVGAPLLRCVARDGGAW